MTYVRADFNFDDRLKILRISKDHNISKMGISCVINGVKGSDVYVVHDALVKGILTVKPELQGIVIHGLKFNFVKLTWDVLCSHGTFKCVPNGQDVPIEDIA